LKNHLDALISMVMDLKANLDRLIALNEVLGYSIEKANVKNLLLKTLTKIT